MKGKSVTLPVSLQCPARISHHKEWRQRAALSLIFGKSLKNISTRVAILIIVHPTVANAGQPGLPTCPASYPYGNSCSRHDGLSVLDQGIQFARRFQASNLNTVKDLLIQKFGKKLACKGIFIEAIGSGDLQSAMRKLDCDIGQDRIEKEPVPNFISYWLVQNDIALFHWALEIHFVASAQSKAIRWDLKLTTITSGRCPGQSELESISVTGERTRVPYVDPMPAGTVGPYSWNVNPLRNSSLELQLTENFMMRKWNCLAVITASTLPQ